ncbi:DcrB-related protein [Enterobacteriaceae bacterium C34A]
MTQNYLCPEGVLHLPDNARAQTINIITLANGQSVNINRDYPASGVDFEGYIQGQVKILEEKCRNYDLIDLRSVEAGKGFTKAAALAFSFMPSDGVTCWQYIVLAEVKPGYIMLFSSILPNKAAMDFSSTHVNSLVESFTPH